MAGGTSTELIVKQSNLAAGTLPPGLQGVMATRAKGRALLHVAEEAGQFTNDVGEAATGDEVEQGTGIEDVQRGRRRFHDSGLRPR